jgi:multidrug efflux pump subunit AcrB
MGIPISFLGAFLFLPGMGVTINMISIFAFIITLGIVVDDAIVIGENIFEYHNRGMGLVRAAVLGTRDVFVPVIFSILTNIIAFLPLFMIPSWMGKIARVIPLVVITVFIISLAESLLILPCHLGHIRPRSKGRLSTWINAGQQAFSRGFIRFVEKIFAPFLDRCIQFRHITTAMGFAILITILAFVLSGRIGIILMPRIESDVAMVTAVLPYGSPMTRVEKIRDYLTDKAWEIVETHGGDELCEGVFADINENQVEVYMYLTDPDVRPLETSEVANLWRQKVGAVPGLESLRFEADTDAPGQGAALTVELSHRNIEMLDKASEKLSEILSNFTSIKDIDDGYSPGKPQLNFTIKPEGQSLGLTPMEIAHQVRHAFYGAEALRQQRGRNEIRVMVKLPKEQRISEYDVEQLLIRTPAGTDVPLMEVAEVNWGRAYNLIDREDGRRSVEVTANIEPIEDTSRVLAALEKEVFPQMLKQFPGLACDWDGSQEELSEGVQTLISGFAIAMFMIFAMLAIPFRSYIQPVIVMVAVPFGIVGAVLGHLIMGYALSLMSIMGIVALSGVVVNDSLVLISYANEQRRQGFSAFEAIHKAGIRRFRPIILTTLTTFGGLTPMIMESSVQGRFLIPMAISLGFGILFSTSITLILVPCFYMMIDDVQRLWKQTANVIQPV